MQIGFGELIVVVVVAFWVLGPEKLPVVARMAGRYWSRAKHSYLSLKNEFQQELNSSKAPSSDQQLPKE